MNVRAKLNKYFLSLSVLTFSGTQILLFTLFPFLSEKLSLPLPHIVGAFSLGSFLFLWGAPFWSSKSDELGRQKVLSYGLLGLSLSFAIIVLLLFFAQGLSTSIIFALLLLSRIIYGSVASAIVPVAQLARGDEIEGGSHMKGMFSHSLALNIGRTLGPLFILVGNEHLYIFLSIIALFSFILVFVPKNQKPLKTEKTSHKFFSELTGLIFIPFIVTILFATYTGMLHSSLGHTLEGVFTLSGFEASQLMAKVLLLGSGLMALTQVAGKLLLKNHFKLGLTLGLSGLTLGALLLAYMNSEIELWAAISLISMGVALIQPSHLALVHERFPKKAIGKKIGLLATGSTLGYALGGAMASIFLKLEINKIALGIVGLLIVMTYINCQKVGQVEN